MTNDVPAVTVPSVGTPTAAPAGEIFVNVYLQVVEAQAKVLLTVTVPATSVAIPMFCPGHHEAGYQTPVELKAVKVQARRGGRVLYPTIPVIVTLFVVVFTTWTVVPAAKDGKATVLPVP